MDDSKSLRNETYGKKTGGFFNGETHQASHPIHSGQMKQKSDLENTSDLGHEWPDSWCSAGNGYPPVRFGSLGGSSQWMFQWLITMVSCCPLSRVVLLPNGLNGLYIGVTSRLPSSVTTFECFLQIDKALGALSLERPAG